MLIGLTGRPAAGKDSAAATLVAAGWGTTAFADALRAEVCGAWGIGPQVLTERATKEMALPALAIGRCHNAAFVDHARRHALDLAAPRSPRQVMQAWGEWRRQAAADHWVRPVRDWVQAQRAQRPFAPLVITDVRHINEAVMLRHLGSHIVRVHRPVAIDGVPRLAPDTADHVSEHHHLIVADDDITNAGSLRDLAAATMRAVWRLAGRAAERMDGGAP